MATEKKPDPHEKPAADPKTTSLGPEAFMTEQEKAAMQGDKKQGTGKKEDK